MAQELCLRNASIEVRGNLLRRQRNSDNVRTMSTICFSAVSARTHSESLFALVCGGLLLLRPART
jgi:hypothetical protein